MTSRSIKIDSFSEAIETKSTEPELDLAMLRAYSIERSVDYGCSLDDVLKLRRRVDNGASWVRVALDLAKDNQWRAEMELHSGLSQSASAFYLHAAACFRLAQAALEEQPAQRIAVYKQSVDAFSTAMNLLKRDDARLEISFRGARHGAWLFKPNTDGHSAPPCVVVWGGADGWGEAFFGSVAAFLERKFAVCLIELPGQGLARLQHRSFLDTSFTDMISTTLDALTLRGVDSTRFGIVGHSFGGSLALLAAAHDDRIQACCTNGGSVDLEQGAKKYPRVLKRIGRMISDDASEEDVWKVLRELRLEDAVSTMHTPVLCLHGGEDPLVSTEEANRLIALRGSHPTTFEYWPEGVHCVYNHSVERNCVMADWFSHQLNA